MSSPTTTATGRLRSRAAMTAANAAAMSSVNLPDVEADDRRREDPGQPGEERRDHPHARRDARRVAARQRRHRLGVDHRPHAEPGFGEAQDQRAEHDDAEARTRR